MIPEIVKPKIIVGIGHRSGHGKDTFAKFVDGQLRTLRPGCKSKKASWAWKLKEIAYDLYKWAGVQPPIYYENNREARSIVIEPLGMTVVDLWVKIGTPAFRENVYDRTWIDYLLFGQTTPVDVLLVPDTRNINEVDAIHEEGGLVVKVHNPRIPDRTGESIDHCLADFDDWDLVVPNDGGLIDLMGHAKRFADQLLKRLDDNES